MKQIKLNPIGIVHSPFFEAKGTPIQVPASKNTGGIVEVFTEFEEGLKDIEGFSHIILIYYFHLLKKTSLQSIPFLDSIVRGVFATRAPGRPNKIGFSVVKLERVEGNTLFIENLDIIDGTPLLDIKPCVPKFDFRDVTKTGWLENVIHALPDAKDDGRFLE